MPLPINRVLTQRQNLSVEQKNQASENIGAFRADYIEDCIYFDPLNGNDGNNGLTKSTPVKSILKLTEKLRSTGFYKVFCCKFKVEDYIEYIGGQLPSIDIFSGLTDYETMAMAIIDDTIQYANNNIIFYTDSDYLITSFGPSENTGNIPAFDGKYISDVTVNAPRVIKLTGKWNSHITSGEKSKLVVNQGNQDKQSGLVKFIGTYLKPVGTLDAEDNDIAFSNFEAYVNAQGDIEGAIKLLESNGYFDDDVSWVNKISYKSESEIRSVLLTYCNNFDLDCKVINGLNIKARLNVNITAETCNDQSSSLIFPKLGTTKKCCNLNIKSKGIPSLDKLLHLTFIEPYSSASQADPIFECSPKINVNWQGTVRLTANRICASEFTLECLDTINNTSLRIDKYVGYDNNDQLIPNTKKVIIHTEGTFKPGTIYTPNTIEALDIKCGDLNWYPGTLVTQYIYAQNLIINARGTVESVFLLPGYTNSIDSLDNTNNSYFTIKSKSLNLPSGNRVGGYNAILNVESDSVSMSETKFKEVTIKCNEFFGGWHNYTRKLTLIANIVRLNVSGHTPFELELIQQSGWNLEGKSDSIININELVFVENVSPNGLFAIRSNDYDVIQNVSVNIKVVRCSLNWDGSHLYCPIIASGIKFKGVISGEIGTIVNTYMSEIVPVPRTKSMLFWEPLDAMDSEELRYSSFPDGVISLKLLDHDSPYDFYIDPYQGDDRCDGLTTGTAIRTSAGLLRAMLQSVGTITQEVDEGHYAVLYGKCKLHMMSPKDGRLKIQQPLDDDPLEPDINFYKIPYNGEYYTILFMGGVEVVGDCPNLSSIISNLMVQMGTLSISGFVDLELRNAINIGSKYSFLGTTNINIEGDLYLNNNYEGNDLIDYAEQRFNPTFISCLNAILYASFTVLDVKASGRCVIEAPVSGSNDKSEDYNELWDGYASISASEIYLGVDEPVAIGGGTTLKAGYINAYCASVVESLSMYCEAFRGIIGSDNYDANLNIQATGLVEFECDDVNEIYSFNGLVDNILSDIIHGIQIVTPVMTGDIAPLYGCNVLINCNQCHSYLFLYGTDDNYVSIKGDYCQSIQLYGHEEVHIDVNIAEIILTNFDYFKDDFMPEDLIDEVNPSNYTQYYIQSDRTDIYLDYPMTEGDLVAPITMPIISGMVTEGSIGWEYDPSEYNSIPSGSVSLVIGHAYGEQLSEHPDNWTWNVIVLDNENELIAGPGVTLIPDEFGQLAIASSMPMGSAEVDVLLTEGVCSIEPNTCTFIDGITSSVNELYIMIGGGGMKSKSRSANLRFSTEAKFAFEVPTGVQLDKVIVSMFGYVCPLNGPASYTPGKLYLGRVVENLVTIEEYDPVVMNVTDMVEAYLSQDEAVLKVISDTIAPDTYSEVELDMDGTTSTFEVEGFFLVLYDEDLAAYNNATNVTATISIDGDTFGPFTIKPVQPLI